ncbi:hypothetical protein [Halobacillus salinus]|uniref:Uncharacterized protein n=1 Tax=Halobacillus salinus TaxID=192814 RepID=A0A4Z0H242_9BACI|nr:hypothetical protein [Halobacillus salinus]TGB03944.1 hypothetical protein E4663_02760 [Halobacillus salinus]
MYVPLYTAIPVGTWSLSKSSLTSSTDVSLVLAPIVFLLFAGFTEANSEETKHRLFGMIYLVSALLFLAVGIIRWLY